MRVVESASVDADHHLRSRCVERLSLQPLDRVASDLAVEVPAARAGLEARKRRLMRGPAGQHDQPASTGGAGGAEGNRLGSSADDNSSRNAALELHLVVEEHGPLRIWFGSCVADKLQRLFRKLE